MSALRAVVTPGNPWQLMKHVMRTSGRVTDAEYVLPDGEVIITHTDPSSHITYANPAFLTSSEFTLEECLGQPQNIVRHPDMPKEAFADLWRTIRSGKSWTGLVKNRRKNGGFYWVRANVTPMVDGQRGEIVGYMSVRVKPTRAEIHRSRTGLRRDPRRSCRQPPHQRRQCVRLVVVWRPEARIESFVAPSAPGWSSAF